MPQESSNSASEHLAKHGYCMLPELAAPSLVDRIIHDCEMVFRLEKNTNLASSSRGHVYAARNLIDHVGLLRTFWKVGSIASFLSLELGDSFGLVRVLYFDKPPDRTWSLGWHKDTAIAVTAHGMKSRHFSRPTVKAGIPHVIASDAILRNMLTLRIHLDEVINENGPLRVVPQSHENRDCEGTGTESAKTILAERGEILAMRPLLSHCSGASDPGTKRHRRILHLEFAASEQLPDNYQWHQFISIKH